uniref:Mitochondrial import inner membrane translocase subunit n=1 Tax=Theileria annulata TaxID=5874 RepID=A0A3B0MV34_THEAN
MSQSSGLGSEFNHLTASQRSAVLEKLNQIQYQDTMDTYNGLVERCFNECVSGFRSKDLDKKETQCVESCVKLFFDFSQRVSTRFAEKQSKI